MSWAAFALPSPATVGLAEQLCAEPRADRPEEDTRACSVAQVAALAAGADGAASQAVALSEAPAPRAEPLRHWRPLLGRPLPPFLVRRRADVMHLGQAEPLQQAGAGLRAAVDLGAPLPPISPVLVVRLAPHGSPQRAELETRLSVWLRGTPGAPLPAAERHRRARELATFDNGLTAAIPVLMAHDGEASKHLARLAQMLLDRTADFLAVSNLTAVAAMHADMNAPVTLLPAYVLGPATTRAACELLRLESLSAGMHADDKGSPSFAALLGCMAALRSADGPALRAFARANAAATARYENRGRKPQPQVDTSLAVLVDEGERLGRNAGEEARAVACSMSKDYAILLMLATAPPTVLSTLGLGTRDVRKTVIKASDDTVTKLFQIMRAVGRSRAYDPLVAKVDASERLTSLVAGKHGVSVLWWLTAGSNLAIDFKLRLLAMLDDADSTELLRLEGAIDSLPLLSQRAEQLALLDAALRHPEQEGWKTVQYLTDMDLELYREVDPYEGGPASERLEEFTARHVEALKRQPPHLRTLLEHTIVLLQTCERPRALVFAAALTSDWSSSNGEGPPKELVAHAAALLHIHWTEQGVASALATLDPGDVVIATEQMEQPLEELQLQYEAALLDSAVTRSDEHRRTVELSAMCAIPPQDEWGGCHGELARNSWASAALHTAGATTADIKAERKRRGQEARATAAATPRAQEERASSALWTGAAQLNCMQLLLQVTALMAGACNAQTAATLAVAATATVLEHMSDVLATGRVSEAVMQSWLASHAGSCGSATRQAQLAAGMRPTPLDSCLMQATGKASPEEAWREASDADLQAAMQQAQQAPGHGGHGGGGGAAAAGRKRGRGDGARRGTTRSAQPLGVVQEDAG